MSFIVKMLIQFLLSRILGNATVTDVLRLIGQADSQYDNNMAKHGHVYRGLKALEDGKSSEVVLKLAIELGVYLVRKLGVKSPT